VALLTAAELPGTGFTAQPAASSVGLASVKYCPALSAGQSGVSAQASESFTAGQTGPDVSEALLQDTVNGARQMLGAFATVASTCGNFSAEVDSIKLTITVGTVPFPAIGDQAVAVQVNVTLTGYNVVISGDVVAIRHGGTVLVVTNVEYPTLDQGLTQDLAKAAYSKAKALW
jgi:enamine deaminase RidA (YjgF/YER057c/UK114 family)